MVRPPSFPNDKVLVGAQLLSEIVPKSPSSKKFLRSHSLRGPKQVPEVTWPEHPVLYDMDNGAPISIQYDIAVTYVPYPYEKPNLYLRRVCSVSLLPVWY